MTRHAWFGLILLSLLIQLQAQDSLYTRRVIVQLCDKKCNGRGYIRQGLKNAERFIIQEIKSSHVKPFFQGSYTQTFYHPVNTFPGKAVIKLNGIPLVTGRDFIPKPSCKGISGNSSLQKIDSTHYRGQIGSQILELEVKKKLTFSVSNKTDETSVIEINHQAIKDEPKNIEVHLQNKLLKQFKSKNIACVINGIGNSDSCLVFTAHYDHLGGLGKTCYFPGANDNASGVSMVLNLLKYYSTHPPKYHCVFVFFAGEEAGLLGSKYFVESKCMDLSKIKFLVNLDLLGTGDDGIMVVNGAILEKPFGKLLEINDAQHLVSKIKKRGKAANSDHYWFSEAGVPCFFIYTIGGISAYHDVFDQSSTLPLTAYSSVFKLLTAFLDSF